MGELFLLPVGPSYGGMDCLEYGHCEACVQWIPRHAVAGVRLSSPLKLTGIF